MIKSEIKPRRSWWDVCCREPSRIVGNVIQLKRIKGFKGPELQLPRRRLYNIDESGMITGAAARQDLRISASNGVNQDGAGGIRPYQVHGTTAVTAVHGGDEAASSSCPIS